jgi:undecaprenyl-diphosphatase
MIEKLIELDKELLLFFNSHNIPWLDPIMVLITNTFAWLPLYLFLIFLIIKDYRKEAWTVLIGIAITILLSDQITSSLMKPYFARLRPSQDPTMAGLVHLVDGYKGGKYGFASSHAANTFATATFFWMLFGAKRKWILILFVWAALITYTRLYLGVHYPGDVLVGSLIGVFSGIAGFHIHRWLARLAEKRRLTV